MQFKYVGDDEREIPAARLIVKPGDTFEVEGDIAKGLEGQDAFEKVQNKTAPKAPKDGE
jgi:hypothetical protein